MEHKIVVYRTNGRRFSAAIRTIANTETDGTQIEETSSELAEQSLSDGGQDTLGILHEQVGCGGDSEWTNEQRDT